MERAPFVFPIRFATRNAAVQTTTRELSRSGVFIRCLESPPLGTVLSMKLYLPGSADGLVVEGVVRELARPEEEAGFWAEFNGIEAHQRAQIAEVLAAVRWTDAEPNPEVRIDRVTQISGDEVTITSMRHSKMYGPSTDLVPLRRSLVNVLDHVAVLVPSRVGQWPHGNRTAAFFESFVVFENPGFAHVDHRRVPRPAGARRWTGGRARHTGSRAAHRPSPGPISHRRSIAPAPFWRRA